MSGFDPWEIRPVHLAARLTCPLFLAHGDLDALIPLSHLHQLAEAAGTHVKMVMEVPRWHPRRRFHRGRGFPLGGIGGVFRAGTGREWSLISL